MADKLANGHIEIELSAFPLVSVSEQGMLNNAERVEMVEALDELVMKRGRHGLILDLSRAQLMPDEQRTFVAEAFHMRADEIAEKWAAIAVIVREPLLANLPLGAFWMRVSPVPTKVFTKGEEACTWMRGCLAQRSSHAARVSPQLGVTKRRVSQM